ncbi:hypothetical protein D1007_42551 [Hordeum vulgare]|nr:hypothetical protein D1007_42551 [Hordeum vulgare]
MTGGWRRASRLHVTHAVVALLLVLERETDLLVGRVGRVWRVEPLLWRQLTPAATHLLRVHARLLRHGQHRDPLRIHMPVVREGDVGVLQRNAVLRVPPRLVHRDADAFARPAVVDGGLALVLEGADNG